MDIFFQSLKDRFSISDVTIEKLSCYADLIKKWSPSHNLISSRDLSYLWERHFLQALSLLPYLPPQSTFPSIVDLGSGSGILGMTLAFCDYNLVTLVESNQKKAIFLQTVSRETKSSLSIKNTRIEEINNISFQIIISRALTSLKNLLYYSMTLLAAEGYGLFLKGEKIFDELEEASLDFKFNYEIYCVEGHKKTYILKVREIFKK